MDMSVVLGVEFWARGGLSEGRESGFVGSSLGLRLMSLKSELLSFCLQRGQVRCACHH